MKNRSIKITELIFLVVPVLLLFVLGAYSKRIQRDTFTQELKTMAGADAASCGIWPDANGDQKMNQCMAQMFTQGKPFWARQERHYMNVHNMSEQWDVSEGYVFTPQRMVFHIERYPPSALRPARIIKYRWVNPHVETFPSGVVLLLKDKEVRTPD